MTTRQPPQSDLERLRAEYARRQQTAAGADKYSLFQPGQLFMIQQRQRAQLALLARAGWASLAHKRILEIGCGAGGVLHEFLWLGATPSLLHGAELLEWRLAEAKAATPHLPLVLADGQQLPYADASFDLVAQYTVFSSILDTQVRQAIAAEMRRVLRPGGLILWYDFWTNPLNPQTRGIRKAEIRALFPHCQFSFKCLTLASPLVCRLAPYSWLACHLLERLRVFNTHYLVAIRPR
ncbi:MAG: class I SAM-dependent methyltransferase [Acidobacteria bacterium]|nr:class I SAM-dependent methyltransferase [Acidobacteriota bacterium]MBI3425552.1 class I SAM-dependent methyltransferase [Acidobacteriota bacterium]